MGEKKVAAEIWVVFVPAANGNDGAAHLGDIDIGLEREPDFLSAGH